MNFFSALGQNEIRTFYELVPLVPLTEWWHLLLGLLAIVLVAGYIGWMYWVDSVELTRGMTVLLTSLRLVAFTALLLFVLNPEKRSETRVVKTSRVSVLVDTSLSMGLKDPLADGEPNPQRRIDEVIKAIENSETIDRLRIEHDVNVYRFDEQPQPELLASFSKTESGPELGDRDSQLLAQSRQELDQVRGLVWAAWVCVIVSILLGLVYAAYRSNRMAIANWVLLASMMTLVTAIALFGSSHARAHAFSLSTVLGWSSVPESIPTRETEPTTEAVEPSLETRVDWSEALNPKGTETRLGPVVQSLANKERGGPVAGILLLTDGRDNSPSPTSAAIAACAESGIPVFPIGIGSDRQPQNARVEDLQAPPRVFPNDQFTIRGLVQSVGMEGQTVTVQLVSADEQGKEAEMIEAEESIRLLGDGQLSPIEFDLSQQQEGKRKYTLRLSGIKQDLDPRDNERSTVVEVIEKKSRILLIAGGPAREFRFLRNQLYRDEDVQLSVWLQSANEGADQEADELLTEFPATRSELYEYDCIIAFDPDWRTLTATQSELLEKWVAEQAGGLILTAGPVFAPEWTRRPIGDPTIDMIRRLYPVVFYSQGSATLKPGRFGGETPFPLEFSREGRSARFLWLGETGVDSGENWGSFDGVFGYYAVNEQKPGADVLARFSDPDTIINDEFPIYMASQYYGAGRVFFQASAEMWRVRSIDVKFFQDYYKQLIRWASQGRLLRDSSRGVLLTEKERCFVGDQIVVQAILRDPQDQPWVAEQVSAVLLKPDGSTETLSLQAARDAVRPGTFSGQFTAISDGNYRISMPVPDSPEGEILMTTVEANIPDLEKARPQRNDLLLQEFANKTSGKYFVGANSLVQNRDDPDSLFSLLAPQDQVTFLPGTPNQEFTRRLMIWLLVLVVFCLACEWTIRRLHRLA